MKRNLARIILAIWALFGLYVGLAITLDHPKMVFGLVGLIGFVLATFWALEEIGWMK